MRHPVFLVLFFVFFSCNRSEKPGESIFEINPDKFSDELFKLSDIAEDIGYIPLDNSTPFGRIHTVRITLSNIYVRFVESGIIKFDKKGKILKMIARRGNGPGEYNLSTGFAVDQQNEKLYNIDRGRIGVYSLDGKFLGYFSTQSYFSGSANDIEMLGSNIFLADYGDFGEYKYHWVVVDSLGNMVWGKKSSDHPDKNKHVIPGITMNYKNYVYYHNNLNDTIFSISPDFKFKAAYLFASGDFRFPKDGLEESPNILHQLPAYLKLSIVAESTHFMLMEYSYKNKYAALLIDKRTHQTFQAFRKEKVGNVDYVPSIENDIDGGLPIEKIHYFYDDQTGAYLNCVINPFQLKAHVASEAFKNSTPKYPEKKKALEQLANSLNENDNPVLMLVKLKD